MMKFPSILLSLLAVAPSAVVVVNAYDVGCLYPPNMPDPFEARYLLHEYSGSYLMNQAIETPVVIHVAALSSLCQHNCVAYHDDKMLNAVTEERPIVSIPQEYHNSWSRMLCIAQCFELLGNEAGHSGTYDLFWDKWGLDNLQERKDIIGLAWLTSQDGDTKALESVLENDDYHPYTVAQIVATEILLDVIEDGWNALGEWTYDKTTGQPIKCTANCERYKDTTGYFPRNHATGKPEVNGTQYIVEGVDKYWQPLDDNDNNGFFSAQHHVTPHIGFMGKAKLHDSVDDFPTAPDPEYNYREEALEVVERLKETASDPIKKQKIAFFDNKLLVINLVEGYVKRKFNENYSFEDEILYIEGMSAGEYEATLMAWRAKVQHDLVRPTTVIQRWGNDQLETFDGNKEADGPGIIAARDFQAFQRVMPHSEYPSGSSCICTAYSEFTDAFTMEYYDDTITDITFGALGNSTGFGCNPEQDPPLLHQAGCQSDFTIPNMKALLNECSQSRLWAGFHFTAAVVEGEKMCAGVGLKAMEREKKLRNGSSFGTPFYQGDARPTCTNPPPEMVEVGLTDTILSSAAATNKVISAVVAANLALFFAAAM
ncbi:expressed unknown protein [Seminavis robusta]|uniref:Vanadium-dependent haloperoxidase NapH1-like second helical-bundle domain-containing protein n=1 Tax=Seminavis robusta TaxID=568900 RepID=A0A9N8EN00_9STRA|nr:expressed unknown protein [Seminavis robusta]|eukprot:Sro1500_g277840.1 n/a (598) ;mRNA; r:20388-22181